MAEPFQVESPPVARSTGHSFGARSNPLLAGSGVENPGGVLDPRLSSSQSGVPSLEVEDPIAAPPKDRSTSDLPKRISTASSVPCSMTTERPAGTQDWEEQRPIDEVNELAKEFSGMDPPPRLYEVMSKLGGKTRFRFGGRCITGPARVDLKFNAFTWIAIALPTAFYFAVCVGHMWSIHPALPILTCVLSGTTILLLLLTSCTDPGIIPRYAMRLIVPGLEEEVNTVIGCDGLDIDIRSGERNEHVMETLESRGYRWCAFCSMIQPPRAKHCRDCDCCVLRNDHHCPFVNNCIGQRNYVYFCGFLFSLTCLGIAVFSGIGSWFMETQHVKEERGQAEAVNTALIGALVIPTAIFLVGVVGLSFFHAFLICQGRTTREVLTGRHYGEGPTLWTRRGPSLIQGHREVSFDCLQG